MLGNDKKQLGPSNLTLSISGFLLGSAGLSALLFGTNPDKIGPVGITSVFILVYVVILSTSVLLKMLLLRRVDTKIRSLAVVGFVPTLVLALMTLKQLTPFDFVLLLVFAALLSFYLKRAS